MRRNSFFAIQVTKAEPTESRSLPARVARRYNFLSHPQTNWRPTRGMMDFKLVSDYVPQGDQPQAIEQLVRGLNEGREHQVLLGVTGSGKTFTMASVIEQVQRPTLVMAHNKTLAAQLYQEFKSFFPHNAIEYF